MLLRKRNRLRLWPATVGKAWPRTPAGCRPQSVDHAVQRTVNAITLQGRGDRIGGYPVRSGPFALASDAARAIAQILLDRTNYAVGIRRRCDIERIVGVRFIRATDFVDVTLTSPCAVAAWHNRSAEAPKLEWSETLGDSAAARVLALLQPVK
jgi:hypothetical protein